MKQDALRLKIFLALTVLGGAIHLLSLRWSMFQYSPDEPYTSAVNNTLVIWTYVSLGAILYGLFLRLPVSQAVHRRGISLWLVLQGGFLAMLGTVVALQARYLAIGSLLTYRVRMLFDPAHEESLKSTFLICMLPIETYGLIEIIYFAVSAFLCGMLITALAGAASWVIHPRSSS